jgi:putative protein-disulfide isomerase
MQLIYVADPMCSWCYGFERPLAALLAERPDLELTLVMGGLRPYTTERLGAKQAREIAGHWQRVAEASGQPFADAPHAVLNARGFVYDTEPAARAVVVVRERWPEQAWPYLRAVQRAFYAQARDVTQPDVLMQVAAELGLDAPALRAAFDDVASGVATAKDFAKAQAWGLRGFPALIAEHGGRLHLAAEGFTPLDVLRERLARLAG